MRRMPRRLIAVVVLGTALIGGGSVSATSGKSLPVIDAQLTFAPEVPPPITRKQPAIVRVRLHSTMKTMELTNGLTYSFWPFGDHVPRPFIRARNASANFAATSSTRARRRPWTVSSTRCVKGGSCSRFRILISAR